MKNFFAFIIPFLGLLSCNAGKSTESTALDIDTNVAENANHRPVSFQNFRCSNVTQSTSPGGWDVEAAIEGIITEVYPGVFGLSHSLSFEVYVDHEIWSFDRRQENMIVNNPDYRPIRYLNYLQFHLDGQSLRSPVREAWGAYELLLPQPSALQSPGSSFHSVLMLTNVSDHFGESVHLNCKWGATYDLTQFHNPSWSAKDNGERLLQEVFGLNEIKLSVDENFYAKKSEQLPLVTYTEAMFFALFDILNIAGPNEHPLNIALYGQAFEWGSVDPNPSSEKWRHAARLFLRRHLNSQASLIFNNGVDELGEPRFPENGESVEEHWIFRLVLPSLSDHNYWSVVDPAGQQATYTYGFN